MHYSASSFINIRLSHQSSIDEVIEMLSEVLCVSATKWGGEGYCVTCKIWTWTLLVQKNGATPSSPEYICLYACTYLIGTETCMNVHAFVNCDKVRTYRCTSMYKCTYVCTYICTIDPDNFATCVQM